MNKKYLTYGVSMFLENLDNKKTEEKNLQNIKQSIKQIQSERDRIGSIIDSLSKDNDISNSEIIKKILLQTHLSKNMVKSIFEEYQFNKTYDLDEKINIKEIKKIKKYFKEHQEIDFEEQKNILKGALEETISKAEEVYSENIFKHQIVLDEDNQLLYEECKKIIETELHRKVKNKSELFTLIMSTFMANNFNS